MRWLDKGAVAQFTEGLHQLFAGVHDDWTVPGDGLINWSARD